MKSSSLLTDTASLRAQIRRSVLQPRYSLGRSRPLSKRRLKLNIWCQRERVVHSLGWMKTNLQRTEEASAFRWRAGSNKSEALRKCEGKRYNGTYLSLVTGGKSARNSEQSSTPSPFGAD